MLTSSKTEWNAILCEEWFRNSLLYSKCIVDRAEMRERKRESSKMQSNLVDTHHFLLNYTLLKQTTHLLLPPSISTLRSLSTRMKWRKNLFTLSRLVTKNKNRIHERLCRCSTVYRVLCIVYACGHWLVTALPISPYFSQFYLQSNRIGPFLVEWVEIERLARENSSTDNRHHHHHDKNERCYDFVHFEKVYDETDPTMIAKQKVWLNLTVNCRND